MLKNTLTYRYVGRYIHMSQGLHEVVTDTSNDTVTWIGSLLFSVLLSVKSRSERNPYREAQTVAFVVWLFVVTFR